MKRLNNGNINTPEFFNKKFTGRISMIAWKQLW